MVALFVAVSFESQKFETLFNWKIDAVLFVRNKLEKVAMSFEKLIKKSKTMKLLDSLKIVNPFVPNAPFLYPQRFFNHKFSGCRERVHWERMG